MKPTIIFCAILLLTTSLFAAPATTPDKDIAAVRKAVEDANTQYIATWKKGDAAGFASLFSDDAQVMPVNHPNIVGRQSIQALRAKTVTAMPLTDGSLTIATLQSSGDLAWETGAFTFKLQPKGAPLQSISGRYLCVWKKQNGVWKIQARAELPGGLNNAK